MGLGGGAHEPEPRRPALAREVRERRRREEEDEGLRAAVEALLAPGVLARLQGLAGATVAAREPVGDRVAPAGRVILSGDPGDEHVERPAYRGVQVSVRVIMQYRSPFVHGSPGSAEEYHSQQRLAGLRAALAGMLDRGELEGFRLEDADMSLLPVGA